MEHCREQFIFFLQQVNSMKKEEEEGQEEKSELDGML